MKLLESCRCASALLIWCSAFLKNYKRPWQGVHHTALGYDESPPMVQREIQSISSRPEYLLFLANYISKCVLFCVLRFSVTISVRFTQRTDDVGGKNWRLVNGTIFRFFLRGKPLAGLVRWILSAAHSCPTGMVLLL